MPKRKFSSEDVRVLVARGWGVQQIAEKLGVTFQAVRHRIRQEKISYDFDSGRNRLVIPDLQILVEQGWKTGDIARKYNLDYRQVWWWIRKLKIPYTPDQSGARNPAWNGGRRPSGPYFYVWCPDHPFATKVGYVLEHRLVMELKIGRYLRPEEVVHHDKGYANNPENLVLYSSNAAHLADTLKGKIPKWTLEGRRRILEVVRQPRGLRKNATRDKSKRRASP